MIFPSAPPCKIWFVFISKKPIGFKSRLYLRSFLVQILLDEEAYKFQKEGLKKIVLDMQVKDALELSKQVNNSIDNLVSEIGSHTLLASHGLLWNIKNPQ